MLKLVMIACLMALTAAAQSVRLGDVNMRDVRVVTNEQDGVAMPFINAFTNAANSWTAVSNAVITGAAAGQTALQAEVDPTALLVDGTRAMAANLPMGGQSITNLGNIQMVGYWQSLTGPGVSTIGYYAYGAIQSGRNYGTQSIGDAAYGAIQNGFNYGTQSIGYYAYGAMQRGSVVIYAAATNNAVGAMQLHDLTAGQNAITTTGGAASILLGAGTVSNKNAIVAGDGQASNGDGSITAASFHGSGAGLTGIPQAGVTGLTDALASKASVETVAALPTYPAVTNIARATIPTNAVQGWLLYDSGSNQWLRVSVSNYAFYVYEVLP
jgi:hypothetical protein